MTICASSSAAKPAWPCPPGGGVVSRTAITEINLKSSVESLTQRCREAESAEKDQKSDGKENHDKKSLAKLFHPIGENKYIHQQWDKLCELCLSAPPMRTFVNRLNRFGDFRFPIPFAWCLSLSYSQCRAAITGFVARLHSVIHPVGVQPLRRTRGARRGTHSPTDGTFKRFRIGLRSLPWRRLLS